MRGDARGQQAGAERAGAVPGRTHSLSCRVVPGNACGRATVPQRHRAVTNGWRLVRVDEDLPRAVVPRGSFRRRRRDR